MITTKDISVAAKSVEERAGRLAYVSALMQTAPSSDVEKMLIKVNIMQSALVASVNHLNAIKDEYYEQVS